MRYHQYMPPARNIFDDEWERTWNEGILPPGKKKESFDVPAPAKVVAAAPSKKVSHLNNDF